MFPKCWHANAKPEFWLMLEITLHTLPVSLLIFAMKNVLIFQHGYLLFMSDAHVDILNVHTELIIKIAFSDVLL